MKIIKLTKDFYTVVDDEDFEYLNQWKWYCNSRGYVARTASRRTSRGETILMHRVILDLKGISKEADHIDGNRLNNTRVNLREATSRQNSFNRKVHTTNKLGIKGVSYEEFSRKSKTPRKNHYYSTIWVNGHNKYLGSYKTAEEASVAYKNAAKEYFGEFANINYYAR